MPPRDCPHGSHPSYCTDCIEGVPPERKPPRYMAERRMSAHYDGVCAANAEHPIAEGDPIGLVTAAGGWCCSRCLL